MTQTASADHPKLGPNLPHRTFATPTKHSPKLSLIENEKQLFRKIACRAGCLPAIKPALSTQSRSRTTTQSTRSHPTNPAISNRNFQKLEIAVTRRKHSLATKSNRNSRSTNSASTSPPLPALSRGSISPLSRGIAMRTTRCSGLAGSRVRGILARVSALRAR